MEQQTSTEYDRVAYPSYTHPQTHPDRMAVIGALLGLQPAPISASRVLEVGCGDATNLIAMAWTLPQSEFVGIDLAATAIGRGKALCRDLGLANVRLIDGDLSDLPENLGRFDYLIAHGVYSWVKDQVRQRLLRHCRERLAPHGIAFISYNAYPGFHLRKLLREMLLFHVREANSPAERLQHAKSLLRFLAQGDKGQDEFRIWLKAECERIEGYPPGHLYHDDLAPVNEACYFTDFIAAAAREDLQYLAEADFFETSDESFDDQTREALREFGTNRILREQYLDFLKCRRFRQTLLCRSEVPLLMQPKMETVRSFRVCSSASCVGGSVNIQPGVTCRFESPKRAKCETDLPLGKAALGILQTAWPGSLPFEQLLLTAREHLAAHAVTVESPEVCREVLGGFLLRLYGVGLVDFRTYEPPMASEVDSKPIVYPLARWQAAHGEFVTSLFHTQVKIEDEIGRVILTWLDGSVDLEQLRDRLWQYLKAKKMVAAGNGEEDLARQKLAAKLTQKLQQLARLGLLVDAQECERRDLAQPGI